MTKLQELNGLLQLVKTEFTNYTPETWNMSLIDKESAIKRIEEAIKLNK